MVDGSNLVDGKEEGKERSGIGEKFKGIVGVTIFKEILERDKENQNIGDKWIMRRRRLVGADLPQNGRRVIGFGGVGSGN